MEPQYHQFGSSDNSSFHTEVRLTPQTGVRRAVVYVLYGVLVLLLLILLMVTGIKFSQLNKEVADVKVRLEKTSHGGKGASSSSGAAAPQPVLLDRLVPVRGTCREGWSSFQSKCYLLAGDTVSWSQAEERCQAHRAHLVVLNNAEELDYISKIVEIQFNYWIGLIERHKEGHWSWVDGTDFNSTPANHDPGTEDNPQNRVASSFTEGLLSVRITAQEGARPPPPQLNYDVSELSFWDEDQPDDWDYRENGEDCGQLHSSIKRQRKLWNDADCGLPYRYICETRA